MHIHDFDSVIHDIRTVAVGDFIANALWKSSELCVPVQSTHEYPISYMSSAEEWDEYIRTHTKITLYTFVRCHFHDGGGYQIVLYKRYA